MKHIKSKKIFESEVYYTIKDICLELEDKGYNLWYWNPSVDGSRLPWAKDNSCEGNISKFTRGGVATFKYSDVKEVVDRLKEYLGSNLVSMSIRRYGDYVWTDINNLYSKTYDNVIGVKLIYKDDKEI